MTPTPAQSVSYRRLIISALAAAAGATLINALLFFIGRVFGAFPPTVLAYGDPFTLLPIIASSFFSVLAAAVVFALMVRFVKHPKRVFYVVAASIFVLMFFTPFSIPAAPAVTVVILELMHLVAAAGAVWAVRQS